MELRKCVDYTLLKSESMFTDFVRLCEEARQHPKVIRSVCVLPDPLVLQVCVGQLLGSGIKVGAVNDFPLGRGGTRAKIDQAETIRENGAEEIDTVINVGELRLGQYSIVLMELKAVTEIFPIGTKVILETGHKFYTEYFIKKATELVAEAGAFCVKTSTGFIENIPVEEKVKHVQWMHEAVPELVKKVAGGVKTLDHAKLFFNVVPADKLIFGASAKFWPDQ